MKIENDIMGQAIRIRNYCDSNLDFVSDMWFDEVNGKYLSDPTREFIDESFRNALDGLADSPDGYYFIVESAQNGIKIGSCCAFPDDSGAVYDIGYCVHRDFWQQGFGTRIVTALEHWIFRHGGKKITA